ncbi:MAG: transglutaminase-like domain-containing protein [Propionicimonas sp.]|uniref:transglutaminase-like domain-containing protein n=1 Tax=Propionicimonas sp. TaxID=1955623 RepID=UPI003D0C93C1
MADDLDRWRRQSPYSDPGRYAGLLLDVADDVESLCAASRNTIVHYRAEFPDLPPERQGEIDSRWLERILALDQDRHPEPLTVPREPTSRVAGCCRDHSLLLVGALRARGVPARNVVGFAGYFAPPFHHDHVVVEYWDGEWWVRTDPELTQPGFAFDVRDMPRGEGAPFETAAEVWLGHRAGRLDAATYGVEPSLPELCGPEFVGEYVVFQLAHRYGDELLLWDMWAGPLDPEVVDELATLLVRADAGDAAAEAELAERYASEAALRPGPTVTRTSPYGYPPVSESLVRPSPG